MKRTIAFAIIAQALSVIILMILAVQFSRQLSTMTAYTNDVEHTYLVMNQFSNVQSYIKDAESSASGYLLTNRKEFLRLLDISKVKIFPALDSLRVLVIDDPEQLALFRKVRKDAYSKILGQIENVRSDRRLGSDSLVFRLNEGRLLMERIERNMDSMRSNEIKLLKERSKAKQDYEKLLPKRVIVFFLLTGLLTLLFGLWIYIELKKRFKYQEMLARKFMELRQNNEELEQIAFAASHDLQEPLRKIQIFSDRLLMKMETLGNEENYLMTGRINVAALRLQSLISDLVTFNNLVQNNFEISRVVLKDIVSIVIALSEEKVTDLSVVVNLEELPVITGSEQQVLLLFQQIFSNAIEFRSKERPLMIEIKSSRVKWSQITGLPGEITAGMFCHVQVKDNGIGFDEVYKSKMFKPFQRLHNIETEKNGRRRGMGLAMSKRVMLNIGGWIDASGRVEEGAVIHLYFPVT